MRGSCGTLHGSLHVPAKLLSRPTLLGGNSLRWAMVFERVAFLNIQPLGNKTVKRQHRSDGSVAVS